MLSAVVGYGMTPLVVGRRLRLNLVVFVISVLFWCWMWGIAGAFLAVPLLVIVKALCEHIKPLQPFGEFLGE